MQIEIRKSAIKDLKQISEPYRTKIGDYRVLFDVENEFIIIGRVLHRKESY